MVYSCAAFRTVVLALASERYATEPEYLLANFPGIFPAYHMNRGSWVSAAISLTATPKRRKRVRKNPLSFLFAVMGNGIAGKLGGAGTAGSIDILHAFTACGIHLP